VAEESEPSGRQTASETSCGLRSQRLQAIGNECRSGGPDGDQTCRLTRIVAVIRRSLLQLSGVGYLVDAI
jgi:hypothetical protein